MSRTENRALSLFNGDSYDVCQKRFLSLWKDMGTPMHSCVSLIFPIALFSGLKNLNRQDAKDAKGWFWVFPDRVKRSGKRPTALPAMDSISFINITLNR